MTHRDYQRQVQKVRSALRRQGIDALGYYGSGDNPDRGWVRIWWSTSERGGGRLRVGLRLPTDPQHREGFGAPVHAALVAASFVPLSTVLTYLGCALSYVPFDAQALLS